MFITRGGAMSDFDRFRLSLQKNRNVYKVRGERAPYPYNYNNNRGYLVTNKDDVTIFFYFNSEGRMLMNQKRKNGEFYS